jgi:hypothetical protein
MAPTVIAFQADESTVIAALRAAGYMPTVTDGAGNPKLVRPPGATPQDPSDAAILAGERAVERFRVDDEIASPPPPRNGDAGEALSGRGSGHGYDSHSDGPEDADTNGADPLLELSEALLANAGVLDRHRLTETETVVETYGVGIDLVQQRQLAYAIDQQLPVKITYRSASGGITTRVISDIEMINGLLYAWCHLRDDDRVFSIDRIQDVAPVGG